MNENEQLRPNLDAACLLVIDMQEYFREIAKPILKNVQVLLKEARSRGVKIIYTQHGHNNPEVDGGMLGKWWNDHVLTHSPTWKILPEVQPRSTELIVHKKRYSAFITSSSSIDLENHLREEGIDTIIICGVMTNLCCETNARDAFNRDFQVFFLSDGTATSASEFQEATLMNMKYGFATLLSCNHVFE